ncbi:hypothetical protein [Hymenobacter koreensis]|uniref:DUF4168 domain-containing protein n=1 Tax=Hymenobacter koreensis TaxID=1084523 RepID=A0ABP8IUY8_9BACT
MKLAAFRSSLLVVLIGISAASFGRSIGTPALSATASGMANQSSLTLTLYLTDALHLSQTQAWAVRECTRTELQNLAISSDENASPDARLQAVQQYEESMSRILTPSQFKAFQRLESRAAVTATVSRVLAVR